MKKWTAAAGILSVVLLMAGCSSSFQPSASSLYVRGDGTLTQAIVETFDKSYYSLSEFQTMVEKELDTYNAGTEKITLNELKTEDGTLTLLLDFVDAEAYADYNETSCFVGTVTDALDQGFSFNMDFKDKNYDEYTAAEATQDKKASVLIMKEPGLVQLEEKIRYVSNNVEIFSEHMAQIMPIEDEDEYAYIIY